MSPFHFLLCSLHTLSFIHSSLNLSLPFHSTSHFLSPIIPLHLFVSSPLAFTFSLSQLCPFFYFFLLPFHFVSLFFPFSFLSRLSFLSHFLPLSPSSPLSSLFAPSPYLTLVPSLFLLLLFFTFTSRISSPFCLFNSPLPLSSQFCSQSSPSPMYPIFFLPPLFSIFSSLSFFALSYLFSFLSFYSFSPSLFPHFFSIPFLLCFASSLVRG